ncbi:hypothetical protein QR685DRAFT_450216 [Neurospora intermedia]|uniref:Uncharacterized protein n=1 Tax=Neurospora intermedia TaxID=5142 RepID=A0ABR3D2U5_NEUIN
MTKEQELNIGTLMTPLFPLCFSVLSSSRGSATISQWYGWLDVPSSDPGCLHRDPVIGMKTSLQMMFKWNSNSYYRIPLKL